MKWIEGPLSLRTEPKDSLVTVYYSSLNFRDVMIASGRLTVDVVTRDRREQECVQGFEFSGKTSCGKRVMGMLPQGTLATLVKADRNLLWEVPEKWSLRDAATVPVVYGTCLYALVNIGKIKPNYSVLIHSGTGGIGQAAINLCLGMGCTVFTTVGTEDKRKYITRTFPQIQEKHIGNSRDITFEQMIMRETNGKGVDIILNSLAEEKLAASVRCLSKNGRFLEIGKFDLANNNHLNLLAFKEGASYHGVMLDKLFNESSGVKQQLRKLLQTYIESGAVKPLKYTVFEKDKVEQAFRFMTTGKHMGKVLVEIRDEELKETVTKIWSLPRYYCDPSKSYIICGGLGGFGLELADWLVLRGAKNLILTSRRGVTTGYQAYRIGIWKSYGCNVKISTADITTRSGSEALIKEANSLAPLAAVFNLAVVLKDAILSNQTTDMFKESFGPKACATQYLEELSRGLCPDLRDFVVFSSVSCGRGNAGQTNYGMSNSVMERICEKRRSDGYPALAIQWGAVGDVGLVAEMQEDHMEMEIGGTLQQSIQNCLQVMDILLKQKDTAIVSSIVVAEKKSTSLSGDIMEVITGILGIRDIKSVSLTSTLAELGMDSMTGVEVKQTLEREYNIFLSPTELRSITLTRIRELQEESISDTAVTNSDNNNDNALINWSNIINDLVNSEEKKSTIRRLRSKLDSCGDHAQAPTVILFPGIEGVCEMLQNLTENMAVHPFGVTYISDIQEDDIQKMVDRILPLIRNVLEPNKRFHIIAHSGGSSFALEVMGKLETLGYIGDVFFIDGSPVVIQELIRQQAHGDLSAANVANLMVATSLRLELNEADTLKKMEEIAKLPTTEEKIKVMLPHIKKSEKLTDELITECTIASIKRTTAIINYNFTHKKLKSTARLYKPTTASVRHKTEDYDLGQYFEQPVDIKVFSGTHTTILENQELAETIMQHLLVSESSSQ